MLLLQVAFAAFNFVFIAQDSCQIKFPVYKLSSMHFHTYLGPCLVRPLSVFHLGQSISGHKVRAKKRGLDKNQKLRQMSQFFLARNFTLSGSRHGEKIGRSGKFDFIFDANTSDDKSLSSV